MMRRMTTTREIQLASRPQGDLTLANMAVVEIELAQPGEGEVLVRNEWMLMASAYRDLMNEQPTLPIPGFQIGQALYGRAVGTVVASNSPLLNTGDLVEHFFGWREHASGPAQAFRKVDRDLFPDSSYFLCNGPTAWQGMVDVAGVREGDTVFVSGATTGVGSVAGQIAKALGAKRVIGSTGSKAKVDYLIEGLGFDAAFDYHDGPVLDQLKALAPEGISVFFDNVGGEQFEAAVQVATPFARFALCGSLSGQLGTADTKFDVMSAIAKQLSIRGFACYHTPDQVDTWNEHFSRWLIEGKFVYPHTKVDGGVTKAPDALIALLDRQYSGNVVVQL
jgi:NADPH-dependent curcumin reductase CurA